MPDKLEGCLEEKRAGGLFTDHQREQREKQREAQGEG